MKNEQPKLLNNKELQISARKDDAIYSIAVRKFSCVRYGLAGLLLIAGLGNVFSQSQTFTASGTFTTPAGIKFATVEMWGGGGAGGGVNASNSENRAGGGGAGGNYTKTLLVDVSGNPVFVVGVGGTGVSAANGNPGGNSTFPGATSALGGGGGLLGASGERTGGGGTVSGGTPTQVGGAGGEATPLSTLTTDATASGAGGGGAGATGDGTAGTAGTSGAGAGGAGGGGAGANGRTTSGNGASATLLSGGGAGGFDLNTNTDRVGGDGFRGQIIVTWIVNSAPGTPTAAAGPNINAAEETAGFAVVVPLGTSGAVAGDIVKLLLGGAPFPTPISYTLLAGDITATFATLNVATGQLGANGAKSITATITNTIGNTSPASSALALNLDVTAPTATNLPTAAAGPVINQPEEVAGFAVVVPLGTSGAVAGDVVTLLLGGSPFPTPINYTLLAGDITATNATLNIASGQLGVDGAKSITARITDIAGNVGAVSPALALTLNTAAPAATSAPTAAAGPIINAAEQTAGVAVVVPLGASGAVAGDVLKLLLGGAPFPTPINYTLLAGDITATFATLNVVSGQLGANGAKSITATVTNSAGNTSPASPALALTLDATAPTATNAPTAAAGPNINAAEETAGVAVVVPLGTSGAVAGDVLTLLLGGSPFPTPINYTLLAGDITATFATLNVATGQLGADGAKSITARVTDIAGNVGAVSPALALTLDVAAPAATNLPTAAAGPVINVAEQTAGVAVVVPLGTSGAVAGDVLTLLLGGAPFPTPINYTLLAGDITATFATLNIASGQLGADGAKSITARVTDIAGNVGAVSPALALTLNTVAPTATNTPTAAAGPFINAAEETAGVAVVVPLGTSGAVAGDVLALLLGGAPFPTPINYTLLAGDITATFATLNVVSGQLGANGAKSITARVTNSVGNTGPASPALALTLDVTVPTAPNTPTAAAGPLINAAEQTAGVAVVVPLGTSGAVAGDMLTLLLGGAPFPTPINYTLLAGDITATFATLNVASGQLGADGAKSITARVTDIAGNVGPVGPALALTLDASVPLAANAPTTAAGPVINGAEYTAGFTVDVTGLIGTGAAAGDLLEIRLGGAAFPTPLTHVLTAPEIASDAFAFTVSCAQMGADGIGKLISARVTDVAGNVGAFSPNLSLDVNTTPVTSASALTFSAVTTTSMTVNFVNGDGVARIVVVRQAAPVSFVPSNNTNYPANPDFAAAVDLGSGNKVVATASGTNITNLPSGDDFYYAVYEYNNCATRQNYLTTTPNVSQATAIGTLTTVSTGAGTATVSSLLDTKAEGLAAAANFSFLVDDDGATNAIDNAPTRITTIVINRDAVNDQTADWSNVIGGVVLTDGTNTINSVDNAASFPPGYLTANTMTISSIPGATLGLVADNTTKTYSVKIWLKTSITGIDIDNKKFVFTTSSSDITVATANSSQFALSGVITSGTSNNVVSVIADQLAFTTIPGGGAAGTGFPLAIAATDVNGNVDLNQTQQVRITAPVKPAAPGSDIKFDNATPNSRDQNMVNGRFAWTNVQVNNSGTYQFRVADNDGAAPLLTLFTSGNIVFASGSNESTIAVNGTFTHPTAIDYKLYQHSTNFTLAAAPPADAIKVAEFVIQDGGSDLTDADGIGTTLTGITFSVTNPGNLQFVGISDGTNMVATQAAGASIAFSGMTLLAEDVANAGTGQKVFEVWASFDPNVVDNQHFDFLVTNVVTGAGGSTFPAANGGGAQSSTTVTNNQVVVSATELRFVQQPPASILLGVAMAPAVTVQATDALGSRDLDNAAVLGMLSTGTLSSAPVTTLASGLGTYSAITHSATATTRSLSTTNVDGLFNATSTNFDITASNASDIIANAAFVYPQNIAYETAAAQEPLNLTSLNGVVAAKFDIRDGGAGADTDLAGTTLTAVSLNLGANYGFIRRIALYNGTGIVEIPGTDQLVGTQIMNFSGFSLTTPDGGPATSFTVRVSFTTAVIDNQQFSFTITSATTQPNVSSTFPLATAGAATSSVAGDNNKIEVTASQLKFTPTDLSSPLLASINISTQQTAPVIKALDVNNNTDLDYAAVVNLASAVTLSTNTLTRDNPAPNAGVYTFPAAFQFTQTGLGTLTATSGALTPAISAATTINAGTATTITAGAAAPATISSLVTTVPGAVAAFNFNINDDPGGTAANNNDGLPTLLSQVVITANAANNTIADWTQVLAGAILTDGTNSLAVTGAAITTGPNRITFTGIPTGAGQLGEVADNAVKNYTLKVYLQTAMAPAIASAIDGLQFEFQVLQGNIALAPNSTGIILAQSSTSGNKDVVAVVATQLKFLSPAAPTSASLYANFPGVTVEAIDVNNNRDLNFTGATSTVASFTNTTSRTTSSGPTPGTTQFTSGVLTFSPSFQYTSGNNGDNVTLTLKAGPGPGTTCGVNGIICATSPLITLQSSSESQVKGDPGYIFSTNVPYVTYQATNIQPVDITNGNGSYELARMLLSDGDADGTPGDLDGAATTLTSISIRIADASDVSTLGHIRRMALYNSGLPGATEIADVAVTGTDLTNGFVTFSGLNIIAPDDNTTPISIRVSFNSTAGTIIDKTLLRASVVAATVGGGSGFGAGIAGIPGGLMAPLTVNFVNVVASKLDFTTQPAAFAGINEPVTAGIVEARDKFDIRDLDFHNITATVTAPQATVNGAFTFTLGVLNMSGLITYGSERDGTLTVLAGGLSSNACPTCTPTFTLYPCNHVDVIHISTVRNDGGPGGVPTGATANLLAGGINKVLLGFTFKSLYSISSPSNNPTVSSFTISFSQSTSGIFQNLKIYESTTGAYSTLLPEVTTLTGTYSPSASSLGVTFSTPRDLFLNPNLSYFLVGDVNINVNGSTPSIKPSIVDGGTGSATQGNILASVGSQLSSTNGPTYSFASIAPPTLISSYPAVAQTNVDKAQTTIELTFSVPVNSLDNKIQLHDKAAGTFVVLTSSNPSPPGGAQPLIFNIPGGTMVDNKEYYVTIAAGDLTTVAGISDVNSNLFPGISSSGILFFRTSSPVPPKLLGAGTLAYAGANATAGDPNVTDITNSGATLNATFDKEGKAFFMVCSTNNPTPPTNAQIRGLVAYGANTVVALGSFDVNTTTTVSQFGLITPASGSFTAGTHYVWMCAETYSDKNHVLTAIPTITPYGSAASVPPLAEIGGPVTGPTLTFIAPGPPAPFPLTSIRTNNANITFCSNSAQILNTPIIIYEGTAPSQQFNNVGPQTLNLVLPAGFQFDISRNIITSLPNYGTLTLQGSDFTGGTLSFLSTSVLRLTFLNTTTLSKDKIIVSGLRIISNGSGSGNIFRLGGNFNTTFTDGTAVANLSAQDASVIDFDNSYSLGLVPPSSWAVTNSVETAIPDNAIPPLVTLIPYTSNAFDFGPSTFSGPGININTLNLNGVTLDVPFNINITHTDQNGCISNNPVQYVVYNHDRAVNITNPLVNRPANIPATLDQGPYCTINPSFQIGLTIPMAAPTGIVRDVKFDNLNAYRMYDLKAAIPSSTPSAPIITSVGPVTLPIISMNNFAGAWGPIVSSLPVNTGLPTVPPGPFPGGPYFDFKFDDKKIINAHAIDPTVPYVYDIFKKLTAPNPNYGNIPQTYYSGGSLGFVEFTGFFRNISNPVVTIKRRQIVEFFVPAVPLVELISPYSFLETTDAANPPLAPAGTNPNNPGTFIYCVGGGPIIVNGWPQADPARGKIGTFKIYNAATGGIPIASGFTDFTNGTAQIDPTSAAIQNGFNDIRIEYTFFDATNANGTGTCSTTGSQVIRISPNPVALFTALSQPSSFVDGATVTAFCERQPVAFSGTGSSVTGTGVSITKYTWNFTDATNSISTNPNDVSGPPLGLAVPGVPAAGTNLSPVHTFIQPSAALPYLPSLVVTSNYNCSSVPFALPVKVGGIPVVKMKSTGVYVGQSFDFSSNNSTVSVNDFFRRIDWTFGDAGTGSTVYPPGSTPTDPQTIVPHTYATAAAYTIDMKLTSEIGCINSLSLDFAAKGLSVADNARARTLIAVDRVPVPTGSAGHYQDFEGTLPGNWVPWFASNSNFPLTLPAPAISWIIADSNPEYGTITKPDPTNNVINGVGFWRTRNTTTGLYTGLERSAVYSPSFDLSALATPMISYNSLVQMESADGVIFEYSTDNLNVTDPNKVWKVLGLALGEGVGWFTDKGIASKPGNQVGNDFGWSGNSNQTWFTSKHVLDDIPNGIAPAPANNVVFRFALASAKAVPTFEGFAFDNIRIGERTRTIMLESFANTANETVSPFAINSGKKEEKVMSDSIAQFYPFGSIGTQVVKLNYHVNFPANDPFNMDNPADPSSRALYYNITSTPKSRLDGAQDANDRNFGAWANTSYGVRSLALASAFIDILPTVTPGKLTVKVDVKAIFPLPANTILHVAIVEKSVAFDDLSSTQKAMIKSGENISGQKFEYSPKKFLPDATGTKLGAVLPVGSTFSRTFTWDVSKLYLPLNDLEVVAFVQQEDGAKEVYQANRYPAKVTDPPIPDPATITAVEPVLAEDVVVFPNPANREMNILLPGILQQEANIQMFDQTGRVAVTSTIPEGAHNKVVNTQDLSPGLYILSIEIGPGNFTRKKVMVVHE